MTVQLDHVISHLIRMEARMSEQSDRLAASLNALVSVTSQLAKRVLDQNGEIAALKDKVATPPNPDAASQAAAADAADRAVVDAQAALASP